MGRQIGQQEGGADAGGPERDAEVAEAVAVGEEEDVGLEREVPPALGQRQPDGAADGRDDRPDHHPADEDHRRGDEQEADRPPALAVPPAMSPAGAERHGRLPRATFGATLRYQPSLIATSQSPPGKTGMRGRDDVGVLLAQLRRDVVPGDAGEAAELGQDRVLHLLGQDEVGELQRRVAVHAVGEHHAAREAARQRRGR